MAVQIAGQGALLSEARDGTAPLPGLFPVRNRIISGLSRGLVVVEAAERSGALITVDLAMEIGRPIYAIPGETTSNLSQGTNQLIRQRHATLITSAADVLEDIAVKELV